MRHSDCRDALFMVSRRAWKGGLSILYRIRVMYKNSATLDSRRLATNQRIPLLIFLSLHLIMRAMQSFSIKETIATLLPLHVLP